MCGLNNCASHDSDSWLKGRLCRTAHFRQTFNSCFFLTFWGYFIIDLLVMNAFVPLVLLVSRSSPTPTSPLSLSSLAGCLPFILEWQPARPLVVKWVQLSFHSTRTVKMVNGINKFPPPPPAPVLTKVFSILLVCLLYVCYSIMISLMKSESCDPLVSTCLTKV